MWLSDLVIVAVLQLKGRGGGGGGVVHVGTHIGGFRIEKLPGQY